jgi:predicted translation initiation factor SUI1
VLPAPAPARGDGVVRVGRESKGRGGKTVTVVRGLDLDANALAELGKRLRALCGAGGTSKDGVIEVQGDHGERSHPVPARDRANRAARRRLNARLGTQARSTKLGEGTRPRLRTTSAPSTNRTVSTLRSKVLC